MPRAKDEFLKKCFPGPEKPEEQRLPGDGGHRSYTRLWLGKKSRILMFSGENDPSLRRFAEIQKRLRAAGIPAPRLFRKDFNRGFLLMEDLGDESLESLRAKSGGPASRPFYFQAAERLAEMQAAVKTLPEDEVFGSRFFIEEAELAARRLETLLKNFLKKAARRGGKAKAGEKNPGRLIFKQAAFWREMRAVCSELESGSFYVFCHRDYHSRNIMIKNKKICLLDFQDGGSGPMAYDLASLLYDSYVRFQESERKELLRLYFDRLPPRLRRRAGSFSRLDFLVRLQFLQRGLKACGCFAGFYNAEKKRSHLPYIRPALKAVSRTAADLGFPAISSAAAELEAALGGGGL